MSSKSESTTQPDRQWAEPARRVGDALDADVWVYAGPISGQPHRIVLERSRTGESRTNVFLVLRTNGGNPHVAYRIGRCLQHCYSKVIVCVPGRCVSAGTLLALGANDLVMTESGTLGPLDIQIAKEDELFESTSGLIARQAMATLTSHASSTFDEFLITLKVRSGGRVRLRTAIESATELTARMYEPLFRQIDPLRLADDERSVEMVRAYGQRLAEVGGNLRPRALEELLTEYSSHQFEIDRKEAREKLFLKVRDPTDAESDVIGALQEHLEQPRRRPLLRCLSEMMGSNQEEHDAEIRDRPTDSAGASAQDDGVAQDPVRRTEKSASASSAPSARSVRSVQ